MRNLKGHDAQLSRQAAQYLVEGRKLTSVQRNAVVRHLVDYTFNLCKTPTRAGLNIAAKKVIEQFGKLRDECDGSVIGTGYVSLRTQLEYRIACLKKPGSS